MNCGNQPVGSWPREYLYWLVCECAGPSKWEHTDAAWFVSAFFMAIYLPYRRVRFYAVRAIGRDPDQPLLI